MVCLDLDHPDVEAFIDWKVTEERKVAMMAAGSLVIGKHWNDLCEAVEGSTTRDSSPKSNDKLRKALARAKAEGVAPAFLAQSLSRLEQGDFARDLKHYDTTWDGDGYVTVGGMNSNNSIRVPDSFMRALEQDGSWYLERRTDGKLHKTVKARDLWDRINRAAWACAGSPAWRNAAQYTRPTWRSTSLARLGPSGSTGCFTTFCAIASTSG